MSNNLGGPSGNLFHSVAVLSFMWDGKERSARKIVNTPAVCSFSYFLSGFERTRQTLDIEYRFDDKIPSPANSKYDKWRKMTFGKGGATFVGDSRVKLPFMKPNVYGIINYFITEVTLLFGAKQGAAIFFTAIYDMRLLFFDG